MAEPVSSMAQVGVNHSIPTFFRSSVRELLDHWEGSSTSTAVMPNSSFSFEVMKDLISERRSTNRFSPEKTDGISHLHGLKLVPHRQ